MVGKPVYLRNNPKSKDGAFMVDSSPLTKDARGKIWMTFGLTGVNITEFSSLKTFTNSVPSRVLDLQGVPYYGMGHVVYRGCFYYHQANTNLIVRFNLSSGENPTMRNIKGASYSPKDGFLYQSKKSFIHFNVDSNGLWIIYVKSGKLNIAMLDPSDLDVINSVQIDIEKESKGNSFIACGNLYTLNHHNRIHAKIDEEVDIWTRKKKVLSLPFSNPYLSNKMISFDYGKKKLYTWDGNIQLRIPVLLS